MRSKAAIIICSLLVVMSLTCSCGKGKKKPVRTAKTEKIRADLRVGVMPVMDCLPLYYASENRLIGKDAGHVELVTYFSALQCAAALRDGKVDMAYISQPEAIWLRGQGCRIRALASTDCDMTVVTNRSKRLKKLSELSGRTIAISRHNPSDLLLDEIATITGIKPYYLLRPQINNIVVRRQMLDDGQTDAAVLPSPYDMISIKSGNKKVYESGKLKIRLGTFAAHDTVIAAKATRIKTLLTAYDEAAGKLNAGKARTDSILIKKYKLKPEEIGLIKLPVIPALRPVRREDFTKVARWCMKRGYIKAMPSEADFISTKFVTRK